MKLKLFVWTDFSPDWSGGLAFAIAKDQQRAEELVKQQNGGSVDEWGTLHVLPVNDETAFCVTGGS